MVFYTSLQGRSPKQSIDNQHLDCFLLRPRNDETGVLRQPLQRIEFLIKKVIIEVIYKRLSFAPVH
jgi:hypothetical protein